MPVLEPSQAVRPAQSRGGIDPVVSERIAMIRFPLIIGVVLAHSLWGMDAKLGVAVPPSLEVLGTLFFDILPRGAVPAFTAIAGFLYFQNFDGSCSAYVRKNQVRIQTLLLPYVLWNVLVFVVFIFRCRYFGVGGGFSGSRVDLSAGGWHLVDAVLGWHSIPMTGQFWFVRNLIFLCALSPLIYVFMCRRSVGFVFCCINTALWLLGISGGQGHGILATIAYTTVFFCWGGYIAVHQIEVKALDRWWKWLFGVWIIISVATWFYFYSVHAGYIIESIPVRCVRLSGCLAVWSLFSQVRSFVSLKNILLALSGFSFFVFALHSPLIDVLLRAAYYFAKPLDVACYMTIEILVPLLVIGLSLAVGLALRSACPWFFAIISGHRGAMPGRISRSA